MIDKQLVSLIADDVTEEKNRLIKELLELKVDGRDIPLSSITLTSAEKKDCFTKAFEAKTWNLPEETKSEYRWEIAKLLNARKEERKQTREATLKGTSKKKPCTLAFLITIEDTSKAIQLNLFDYYSQTWFKPYMDQP